MILFTGFEPFGGETVNPALEAVRLLPDSAGGMPIRRLRLPTSFRHAGETLLDHLAQTAPDVLGGFIHVPYAAEQTANKPAGTPSLTVAQMTQALTCAAGVIAAVCQKGRSVI